MKVVIFCGGKGTRLKEETEYRPKPLVSVGGMPILWHIMKHYSHYGYNEFILCLGYKGDMIKKFFLDYEWMANDFTINLKNRMEWITHFRNELEDWKITLAETGEESMTARRLKLVEKYIDGDTFMLTYGDGVSNVNIKELLEFHKKTGKIVTLTGIHPPSKYGVLDVKGDVVKDFREKPVLNDLINGGFMVMNKKVFEHIKEEDNTMLVDKQLPLLSKKGEVNVFVHKGSWYCMDTYRDYLKLNEIWNSGKAPWKTWN